MKKRLVQMVLIACSMLVLMAVFGCIRSSNPEILANNAALETAFDQKQVCRMYVSGDQTKNGDLIVPLDTDSHDPDNISNTTTYRMTPSIAGYYQVNGQIRWKSGMAAGHEYGVYLKKNGSTVVARADFDQTEGVAYFLSPSVSDVIYCNGSTDYLTLHSYSSEEATYEGLATSTFLSIALIAAD